MATVNMHKKLGEVQPCRFWDVWSDRQKDQQTYSSQYFAHIPRSK